MTRITCCQLAPVFGDTEANAKLTVAAIAQATEEGADIVILPELASSGYMFARTEEAADAALALDAPILEAWRSESARTGAVVIAGFPERGDAGAVYNSAVVFDGGTRAGVYRKTHLWDEEKRWFTPGAEPPRVFDTRHGRIGVLVCYDLEFPEMTRTVALAGAELIAVPTNWPLVPRPDGERPPEVTIAIAAARGNCVFVACADRTGTERGQEWTAGTTIVSADGWVLDRQPGVGTATADVDLSRARDKRYTALADAFADRRPELYGAVVAARPDATV